MSTARLFPLLLLLLPVLLAACGSDPKPNAEADDSGAGGADPTGTTAYDPDALLGEQSAAVTAADYDQGWAEASLAVVFDRLPGLHATPVLRAYRDAMDDADPDCPSRYSSDGNQFWYANCTSDAGTGFSGYAFDYVYDDVDVYGDGNRWDAVVVSGAATFTAGGDRYDFSGSAYTAESAQDGYLVSTSDVYGWFEVTGDRWASEDWMTEAVHPSLSLYAVTGEGPDPARYLSVSGLIGGLAPDLLGVDLDRVSFANAGAGYSCADEATGVVALRDADGAWWEVHFDVDPDSWEQTGPCDGCGQVYFQGELAGEACADPSALLGWGGEPW